jgi:hypothetical protein
MATKFDCMCCCMTLPLAKQLVCPSSTCNYEVCVACQKTTLALAHGCMSCKMTFTKKFLTDKLGKTFVNGPLRKYQEEPLFEREKALLPETQPLVEWERIRRREMDKTRFRKVPNIPPRPQVGVQLAGASGVDPNTVVFPCPKNTCRGFVVRGKCGVCSDAICVHCREVGTDAHVCDKAALETVRMINTECKSCPQCATMIYRTDGCNHMRCTACRTHFDWESGRLLKSSSNHHYDDVAAFSVNVVLRDRPGQSDADESDVCEEDTPDQLRHDRIPLDVMQETLSAIEHTYQQRLLGALYDDPAVIRTTKDSMYHEITLVSNTANSLIASRVKYMMGELTEAQWKTRIAMLEKQKDRDLHIAEVLNIYLTTVRDFQSYARQHVHNIDHVLSQFVAFINMCNVSFDSLREEYGGPIIRLRDDFSNPNLPAIVM